MLINLTIQGNESDWPDMIEQLRIERPPPSPCRNNHTQTVASSSESEYSVCYPVSSQLLLLLSSAQVIFTNVLHAYVALSHTYVSRAAE